MLFFTFSLQKSSADVGPKMSLAERMKILQEREEQWKAKGKGVFNDSTQYSVAGRMAKRGGDKIICLVYSQRLSFVQDFYFFKVNAQTKRKRLHIRIPAHRKSGFRVHSVVQAVMRMFSC